MDAKVAPQKKHAKRKVSKIKNLKRTKSGMPVIAPKPSKELLGRDTYPDTEDKRYLEREKHIEQVEVLMVKGVTTQARIARELGLCTKTVKQYMEIVEYKWAVKGSGMRKVLLRGKARARLEIISDELWQMYEKTNSDRVRMDALSRLITVHEQQMLVDGLTPKVLVQIGTTDSQTSEDSFSQAADRYQRLAGLAEKFADYIDGSVVSTQ